MKKLLLSFISILFGFCMLFTSSCKMIIDIEKIEFLTTPETTTYNVGEFNYSDYVILATYTDGSVKEITLTPEMLSDYDRRKLNDEGVHTLTVNYEGKQLTLDVIMTLKTFEDDEEEQIVMPYLEDAEFTYDGKEHTIEVQGDIPENAIIYYPNGNTFTKAGTYNVTCKVVAEGYETISLSSKVVISKAEYDLSGLQLVVDYGNDEDGNPKTSFEYDGKEHYAYLSGDIPEGLSNPTYYIGLEDEPFSTYVKGKSATNAGNYIVYAMFTGDSANYETDSLYVTAKLTIDKKVISQEGLDEIVFEDKTIYYDGKEHRLTIENIVLPDGVSVEYVDEEGKLFKAKKEANEEGYLVIAKFILDNQNYQILNSLSARLYIKKLDYSGSLDVTFDNDSHQINYSGEKNKINIVGTDNNVWATNVTIDGIEYDLDNLPEFDEAGDYVVTVDYDNDPNYNAVDSITTTLTINPIDFGSLVINLEDEEITYDGQPHSQTYEVFNKPIGSTVEVSYIKVGEEETYENATPTDIVDVGSYITTCKLIYNPENYINAPQTYDDIVKTFTISKRYYDAKNIINLKSVRTTFTAGVNQINLCTFDEILPDWILNYRVIVFNEQGISTTKVIDAGLYQYQFEFFYYDGTKEDGDLVITSEKCNLADLKVVGKQIRAADYDLSYTSVDTYDENTSHIPTVNINLDSSVNPRYTMEYYYEGYSNNNEKTLVDEDDYIETSKLAGNHYFTINIMAYNYETLTINVEILVNRKEITINKYNYGVNNYVGDYDGLDHSDQFICYPESEEELKLMDYSTVLEVNTYDSINPGIDVGSYKYAVKFTPKDINYVVNQEYYSLFKYSVTINKVDIKDLEVTNPYGYFKVVTENDGNPASTNTYVDSLLSKNNTTLESNLSAYLHDYDTKNYKWSYVEYTFDYSNTNYKLTTDVDSPNDLIIENVYGTNYNNVSTLIFNDTIIDTNNKSLNEVVNCIKEAGTYYLVINFEKTNITLYDDTYAIIKIVINPISVTLSNPHNEENDELSSTSNDTFSILSEGLNAMSGDDVDYINSFDSKIMYLYEYEFDSNLIYIDALQNVDNDKKDSIKQNWKIVIKKTNGALVTTSDLLSTIFDFNNADSLMKSSKEEYTSVATYYVFIDLGNNTTFNNSNKIVYKIDVTPVNLSIDEFVTISNNDNELTSTTRTYKDISSVKQTNISGKEVNVTDVDTVTASSDYNGATIYQYVTNYDGTLYDFTFCDNLDGYIKDNLNMSIIYSTQKLKNGGTAVLSTNYNFISVNNVNPSSLSSKVSSIYTTMVDNQIKYTSVGVYYLLITIKDDNIKVNNEKKFGIFIHVKPDFSNKEQFEYEYDGTTYDLTTGVLPTLSAEFVMNKASYDVNDTELKEALESIGTISSTSITPQDKENAYTSEKDYTLANFECALDNDRFGGLVFTVENVKFKLVPKRIEINLDEIYTCDLSTIKYDNNADKLVYHSCSENDVLESISTTNSKNLNFALLYFSYEYFDGYLTADIVDTIVDEVLTYEKIDSTEDFSLGGTHSYILTFTQDSSQSTFKYINLTCNIDKSCIEVKDVANPGSDYFEGNHKELSFKDYSGTVYIKGSAEVEKLTLYMNDVSSLNWANDFRSGKEYTNKEDVVSECYIFCGAYKDDTHPNKFLESIPSFEDAAALIEACVVVEESYSDYYKHGLTLTGNYAKNYKIELLRWKEYSINGTSAYSIVETYTPSDPTSYICVGYFSEK